MLRHALTIMFTALGLIANAQKQILLWPNGAPGAKVSQTVREVADTGKDGIIRISNVVNPLLEVYVPAHPNGCAVIICPGGGYARLAWNHEGTKVAALLGEWGVTAFVLKYRLPNDAIMENKSIGPLQDAQRAIQLVRERAGEWKLDTARIGIMGFSAGGHLASTAATHFEHAVIPNDRNTDLRPSFAILGYPVITFIEGQAHMGSRKNLLGANPSEEQVRYYSNDLQVTNRTPPVFLVHASDDKTVPMENSLDFAKAVKAHQGFSELHLYPHGGHGFGLVNKTTPDVWTDRLKNWMTMQQYIP